MLYIFEVYVYVNSPPRSETFLLLKWAEIPKSERFSGIPTLLVDGPPRGSDPNQTWLVVFPPLGFTAKFTPLPEKNGANGKIGGPDKSG